MPPHHSKVEAARRIIAAWDEGQAAVHRDRRADHVAALEGQLRRAQAIADGLLEALDLLRRRAERLEAENAGLKERLKTDRAAARHSTWLVPRARPTRPGRPRTA